MSDQLFWYTARAGGIVGWALLSASVLWGLLISTRVMGKLAKRPWLLDLHRYLGGLALIFTGVHVVSIIADSYVHFGLVEVLVPFASSWKPLPVAWGIVSLYLLLAVELTSLVRNRLSKRVWHAIHLTSLPLFAFSTIHMLTAGTDGGNGPLRWSALLVSAAVAGLVAMRVQSAREKRDRPPRVPVRVAMLPVMPAVMTERADRPLEAQRAL
jgi:DMSO/TMAO reductase YedYZ heme-binding membrane subunit